jgi:hypothetical protein
MSKYIHLKKRGWKCITWLRDPVERIISFYSQRRDAGFMFDMPDFMDIDILEWSRRLTGTYNLYLDCDLELLDFVGFTETYNESLKEMEKILRCEFDIYDKRNVTKVKADITEGEREIIRHHQSEDINIYNELYDKWSTRSRIKQ